MSRAKQEGPRVCCACGLSYPKVEFYISKSHSTRCVQCSRQYERDRYVPTPRLKRTPGSAGSAGQTRFAAKELDALTRSWGKA